MKPYLQESELLASLVKWGGLILELAIILSPFLIIRLKRFRPTQWRHIIGAYLTSFGLYVLIVWYVLEELNRYLYTNYVNTQWLQQPLDDIALRSTLLLLIGYPLLIFYVTKLKFRRFNRLCFYIDLLISIGFFIILVRLLFYVMAMVMGQIGAKYF